MNLTIQHLKSKKSTYNNTQLMQCVTTHSLSLLTCAMSVMLRTNVTYAVCYSKCVVFITLC